MQSIDFSSLNYKIQKPSTNLDLPHYIQSASEIKLQMQKYLTYQDTQASNCQQQTTNPFRRTNHLFKHVNTQQNSQDKAYSLNHKSKTKLNSNFTSKSQPYLVNALKQTKQQITFSLQNFSSFNKCHQSNISVLSSQRYKPITTNISQDDAIRIQSSQYQPSDQFSLIMDDFNCQLQFSDLIHPLSPTSPRRVKTQYFEKQNISWIHQENSNQKNKKHQQATFFCLTAQQQSQQSTVKEFYFDLKPQIIKPNTQFNKANIKKQLKSLLRDFIDDLQIMNESDIDPEFYVKLQNCLTGAKKIAPLKFEQQNRTDEYLNNPRNNTIYKNYTKMFPQNANQPKKAHQDRNKNKQNAMNIKNIYQSPQQNLKLNYKILQQNSYDSMKKRKWVC